MRARSAAGLAVTCGVLLACSGSKEQDVLVTSSGTSGSTSGGTSSSGGMDGGADCPQELEPNDSKERSTLLAPTRCGIIQPVGDVDLLTFTLKPGTQKLEIKFQGQVKLTITVQGAGTVVLPGSSSVPFVRGKPYYVEIKPVDPNQPKVPWRVDVVETP